MVGSAVDFLAFSVNEFRPTEMQAAYMWSKMLDDFFSVRACAYAAPCIYISDPRSEELDELPNDCAGQRARRFDRGKKWDKMAGFWGPAIDDDCM
jgi:hypothetical protein